MGSALGAAGLTLSCAESCSGGLAAAALTGIPGASSFFMGGIVSYSNIVKERLLNVPTETLSAKGAVSEEAAIAMAKGAAAACLADCAFSITGIAGPDGGSSEKPVGTVWLAYSIRGVTEAERMLFTGGRAAIRHAAASRAMERMAELVRGTIELDNPL